MVNPARVYSRDALLQRATKITSVKRAMQIIQHGLSFRETHSIKRYVAQYRPMQLSFSVLSSK